MDYAILQIIIATYTELLYSTDDSLNMITLQEVLP
jgi:hypothetical protein